MKWFLTVICLISCSIYSPAQIIKNPVFDRSDAPSFRVERVEITTDTTYVYCTYHAEEQSWACISDKSFLENVKDGTRFPILKVSGIPFSPQKRDFFEESVIQVVLFFPHISADKINIIENEDNESFNIYGIDLKNSYERSYTENDIETYYNLAMANEEKENWQVAVDYLLKQLEASKFVYGIRSKEASWPMYSLTMQYFGLGEYEKIIEWGKQAIDILSVLSPDSINLDVLARAYGNVGTAYYLLKLNDLSSQYKELSLSTRRLKDGVGTYNYEEYLKEMAKGYYYEANYPKALLYGKEVANIYEQKYRENPHKYECVYINSLNNLCEFYQSMDLFEEAIKVGKQARRLVDEGACKETSWLKFAVYNNLAAALSSNGQIDEGISYLDNILKEAVIEQTGNDRVIANTKMVLASILLDNKRDTLRAINLCKSVLRMAEDSIAIGKHDYPVYTAALHKLFIANILKDKNTGLEYLRRAIQVQKEWQGEESVAYANLLIELADNIVAKSIADRNTDSLFYCLYHATKIIKRHINNSIHNMSKMEMDNYWNRYKDIFSHLIPSISCAIQSNRWNSLAYDASLFYKGLLLSSENEFKKTIQSSNDTILQRQYMEYIHSLSLLEDSYSNGNFVFIDSLKSKINDIEFLLSQKVTRLNKLIKGTNYSWMDVKNNLNEDDVAMEIVSYSYGNITYYDAYILNCKSPAPQLVSLFYDEGKLKEQLQSDSIDYSRLSMFIWENDEVEKALNGMKNIYFSPSGLLNSIGIEFLPISNGQYIFDKYNLFRLSSTRELCFGKSELKSNNVCLFGGLDYNSTGHNDNENQSPAYRLSRSLEDSIVNRGGFESLAGSKQEINQVKDVLSNKGVNCSIYTDSFGTEEAFRDLSGKSINIIHLSTHGMYIPYDNNVIIDSNNLRFVMPDEMTDIDEETRLLTRSFLVMSGGNMLIRRDSIPNSQDDGILTALEISHLDFKSLDLVVLSACQTALGKIESEGVYGLQRGFKKAGANTILMSLDKVDDEATKILMVDFYKNLMSGKTKHQSLKDAQKHLRQVDNGKYDKPEYWASFIMLDGLN